MKTVYLDCGNTRLKWRLSTESGDESGSVAYEDLEQWAGSNLFTGSNSVRVGRVVFAAVRFDDGLAAAQQAWLGRGLEVVRVRSSAHDAGVTCAYPDPSKLGVDRWLAVIAAWNRSPENLVVIDAGTAITVDVVRADGQHVGGFIVPGLALMLKSLALETERVKVRLSNGEPSLEPAVETAGAVNRGAILMAVGLVEQAMTQLRQDTALSGKASVFVCGGDGTRLLPHIEGALSAEKFGGDISVYQATDLVLDGLEIVDLGR